MAVAAAAAALLPASPNPTSLPNSSLSITDVTIPDVLLLPDFSAASTTAGHAPFLLQCRLELSTGSLTITSQSAPTEVLLKPRKGFAKPPARRVTIHLQATASTVFHDDSPSASAPAHARVGKQHALLASLLHCGVTAAALLQHEADAAVASLDDSNLHDGMYLSAGLVDCWLQLGQVFILGNPTDTTEQQPLYVPSGLDSLLIPAHLLSSGSSSSERGSGMQAVATPRRSSSSTVGSRTVISDYSLRNSANGDELARIVGMKATQMRTSHAPLVTAHAAQPVVDVASLRAQQEEEMLHMPLTYRTTMQAEFPLEATTLAVLGLNTQHSRFEVDSAAQLLFAHNSSSASAALATAMATAQSLVSNRCASVQLHTQAVAGGPVNISRSLGSLQPHLLAGLLRTAAQEATATTFQVTNVCASPSNSLAAADVFGRSLQASVQFVPRLQRELQQRAAPAAAFQLLPRPKGALDSLVPVPLDISTLQPGQLLLAVRAVGINFRDVLNVLGMYPGDPGDPGSDFAGVVQSGPGSGSTVFGFATGCLASHVITSAMTVAPMPPNISFEDAAAAPTICITADVALNGSAALQPGETLLMPAAAGGVGLASLQQVIALGAQMYATAGGPAKRALLRSMGVKFADHSRDAGYVEQVCFRTMLGHDTSWCQPACLRIRIALSVLAGLNPDVQRGNCCGEDCEGLMTSLAGC